MTPMATSGSFGRLLRHHRRLAGLTQEELAERAELSPRGLAYLETGRRSPHHGTVRRLADALALSPEDRAVLLAARDQPPVAREEGRRRVIAPLTPLLGRDLDEEAALDLLRRPEVRLVTLTGVGGVGKTRLGLRVAERRGPQLADGAVAVRLDAIREADLVLPAIAQELGVAEELGRPLARTLGEQLQGSELLLLLDNFEHVQEAVPLVVDLLVAAPALEVLVTSRSPLRVPGEHVLVVGSLAPQHARDLFVDRARAVRTDVGLDPEGTASVAEICRRLDGLPLALELAAARARVMSVGQLASRLDDLFRSLGGPGGWSASAPARQQTLQGHAGLELRPALRGRAGPAAAAGRVRRRLDPGGRGGRLHVRRRARPPDRPRRPVAGRRRGVRLRHALPAPGAGADVRAGASGGERGGGARPPRACRLPAGAGRAGGARAAGARPGGVAGPAGGGAREPGGRGGVAAHAAPDEDGWAGLRLASALCAFWWMGGRFSEGRAELAALLELAGDAPPAGLRAHALYGLGQLAFRQGDRDEGRALLEAALAVSEEAGDPAAIVEALRVLARLDIEEGRHAEARTLLERCVRMHRSLDDPRELSVALTNLSWLAMFEGDLARAEELLQEALAGSRARGEVFDTGTEHLSLGHVALGRGDAVTAASEVLESLRIFADHGYRYGIAYALEGLADVASFEGRPERALRLGGAAAALRDATGASMVAEFRTRHDRRLAAARAALGDAAAAAFAAGWALPLDAAIAEAKG